VATTETEGSDLAGGRARHHRPGVSC